MKRKDTIRLSATLMCIAFTFNNQAQAAQRIYSPYVTPGELELEYFGSRSFDDENSKDNEQKHQIAVGYGVNEWWKTEFYGKYKKAAGGDTKFDQWEWENIFQLTERGEYVIDVSEYSIYDNEMRKIDYYQLKHTTKQYDKPFMLR